jgi:HK97 gp10 family phage protein
MVRVELKGLEDARRQVRRVVPIVEREAKRALRTSTARTRATARALAPVRTGALRDAIEVIDDGPLQQSVAVTGAPSTYARFPEFGTVTTPAHPFMRPAADSEQQPFVDGMARTGRILERELSK